jgi:rubrerythrin
MPTSRRPTTADPAPPPDRPDQTVPAAATLADLTPDPHNRRRHGDRNLEMIAASLRDVGAARSIVVDEHNEVLAGNGVVQGAARAGLTKVQIVEADRDTIIAVRRRDLTPEEKRRLALYDNRTGELAEWNADQLRADQANGLDLQPFFNEQELTSLLKVVDAPETFKAVDVDVETEYTCPKCGYEWSGGKNG